MRTLVVIPARLAAIRLPHKPLRLLGGRPLVVRVWEHVSSLRCAERVVVATDAREIASAVTDAGGEAVMTDRRHPSGTDRVAEVAEMREFQVYETLVNVQGDEPFIPEAAIAEPAAMLSGGRFSLATAAVPTHAEDADQPSVVKVVVSDDGRAMYFSRAPIPYLRDPVDAARRQVLQHIGVYAYTRESLAQWVRLPVHQLERIERLEQLRPLAAGIPMGVAIGAYPPEPGIDTEDDLRRANARWNDLHAVNTHA
jgi:3-deoxy-manno-octulosonate cytidylyltransferase (CMP-KDO synthetase)